MSAIIFLSSFLFSDKKVSDPNIYPYNVFSSKYEKLLLFAPITILYGSNASGKSTMLNIIANKLNLQGFEYANQLGSVSYFGKFVDECSYTLGDDEEGISLTGCL